MSLREPTFEGLFQPLEIIEFVYVLGDGVLKNLIMAYLPSLTFLINLLFLSLITAYAQIERYEQNKRMGWVK